MRVLVTGANGFVGSEVCEQLAKEGHQVFAAVRELPIVSYHKDIYGVSIGDISLARNELSTKLQGIDVVVHTAARVHVMQDNALDPIVVYRAVNVEGTKHLLQAAIANGVKRFIFISSIKVNGEATYGRPFTENDEPDPQDPYAQSKYEAEQYLLTQNQAIEIVILRCPLMYGKKVKANFAKLINLVRLGLPLPFANINNKRSLLCVTNLASAISHCVMIEKIPSPIYLISDLSAISTSTLINIIAASLQVKIRLFSVPTILFRVGRTLPKMNKFLDRLLGSLEIDSRKIRLELNWQSPLSVEQGIHQACKLNEDD